eukprot:TRINITY_DN507_c0_g1_i1.p1 TRINITY_DN507_c0_g1~~TRINITY_DN507_c0_g1_i1.p1  ORF type:complete len:436 (+),score=131.74 TRINITY_DN507_c0_g1_i1:140-1447(+)
MEESEKANEEKHEFWDTQPVPKLTDDIQALDLSGPLEKKTVSDIPKTPYPLPSSFEWFQANVDDPAMLDAIYDLLCNHYVEDDDAMFRFAYAKEFLLWAMKPPGYCPEWHIGVRVKTSGALVGFITGIPVKVKVDGKEVPMAEINFLCVHKKLRTKKLAPVLIREITRRVNLLGVFQAVYTAGVLLPRPVARCRYHHRSLNARKLVNVGFTSISHTMRKMRDPMAATERLYKLPDEPLLSGIRPMVKKDVPDGMRLLQEYLSKFRIHPIFTKREFSHWFLPRDKVVYTYVVPALEGSGARIRGMVSFYSLPSQILSVADEFSHIEDYKELRAAYCFYYAPESGSHEEGYKSKEGEEVERGEKESGGKVCVHDLLHDALVLARRAGFDVFNALDLLDSGKHLESLKFGIGDGSLHYYLFNYVIPPLESDDVGMVLL